MSAVGPSSSSFSVVGPDLVGRAFGQRVLDDLEGRVGLAQLGAQLGHLGHGDAAVVDGEDRLGLVYVGGDLGDRHGLLVSVHWAPVPGFCSPIVEIGRPPGVSGGL